MAKETYFYGKRDLYYGKGGLLRLAYLRHAKETQPCDKRDPCTHGKRALCTFAMYETKETYVRLAKEPYARDRNLYTLQVFQCMIQKRPMYETKEPYV